MRTDKPPHFSVKNMVPSCKNAMSQGSLAAWKTSAVTLSASAFCVPISPAAAMPAAIKPDLSVVLNFMQSPCCVKVNPEQMNHPKVVSNARKPNDQSMEKQIA
jgi:hypothetical protein